MDIAPGLLERAEQRARAERLQMDFLLADVEDLPFEDDSFDAVVSAFGLPFASDARTAVSEVARVCRPGGTLALTAWAPGGPNAVEDAVFSKYLGAEDAPGPWGEITFRFPSTESYVDTALETFGPLMTACRALAAGDRRALRQEWIDGLSNVNESGDETLVVPFPYFEVVARVGGS